LVKIYHNIDQHLLDITNQDFVKSDSLNFVIETLAAIEE
jgi:hypothetical protein